MWCLNIPFKKQILQRCASLGFGEPFYNICAGESPRNEVEACWFRLVQNLSLNPVPHHINQGVLYVYILPISACWKKSSLISWVGIKMLVKCRVFLKCLQDNSDISNFSTVTDPGPDPDIMNLSLTGLLLRYNSVSHTAGNAMRELCQNSNTGGCRRV